MSQNKINMSEQVRRVIQQALKDSGMSQAELARVLGIGRSMMSRVMSGGRNLSWPHLEELGELLGLKIVADGSGAERLAAKLKKKAR
jgi:transcriptional regulator with XRE-family HTH domain